MISELEEKSVGVWPVKFLVGSADHAAQVIRKARMLRTKEGYGSIYLCPERKLEESRWNAMLSLIKYFSIKNNKIISLIRSESARG